MRYVIVLLFFLPVTSFACKCAKFSSPKELFEKSDFVFYGTSKEKSLNISGVSFEIQRLAKCNEAKLGSRKIVLAWAGDQSAQCRSSFSPGDYLVFATKVKNGYSFLTDCYSETVSVKGGEYVYKGAKQSHFDFFDVNPVSAINGLRPRYAEDLPDSEAKDLAKQHLFQNTDFRKRYLKELSNWKALSSQKMSDEMGQTYWKVKIAFDSPRAKDEFYFVRFYNSLRESFKISPGE